MRFPHKVVIIVIMLSTGHMITAEYDITTLMHQYHCTFIIIHQEPQQQVLSLLELIQVFIIDNIE